MNFDEYMEGCSRAQMIVLGPGRVGKTSFVYSATHTGKTLGIEAEEGVHSAKDYIMGKNLEIEPLAKRVKNLKSGKWESLPPEKQPPIRERLKELVVKAFTGGYKNVIVDSLTDVAGRFEDEYARTGVPHQNDWYKITEGIKSFVRDLKNGPFNLLVTCIAQPPKEGALIGLSAALPGSLRDAIPPMFQSIVLIRYDKKERRHKLVVNDPGLGVCDRFKSFGEERDVDITNRPLWAMRTMIEAPQRAANPREEVDVSEDEEEGSEAPPSRPVKKFVPRRFKARPMVGRQ